MCLVNQIAHDSMYSRVSNIVTYQESPRAFKLRSRFVNHHTIVKANFLSRKLSEFQSSPFWFLSAKLVTTVHVLRKHNTENIKKLLHQGICVSKTTFPLWSAWQLFFVMERIHVVQIVQQFEINAML